MPLPNRELRLMSPQEALQIEMSLGQFIRKYSVEITLKFLKAQKFNFHEFF